MSVHRLLLDIAYRHHDRCPLCGAEAGEAAVLGGRSYQVGRARVAFPAESPKALAFLRCARCRLVFKEYIPTPASVARVLAVHAWNLWRTGKENLAPIGDLVRSVAPPVAALRILDVGSGDGGILSLFSQPGVRRSALDIAIDPRCRKWINGDAIEGAIDAPLDKHLRPHDVVLAFDVLEHLHNPALGLRNLAQLVRAGGNLVAQTGNADYPGDGAKRLAAWWYLRMFVHHVAWSPATFHHLARTGLWNVRLLREAPHKAQHGQPRARRFVVSSLRVAGRVPVVRDALGRLVHRDLRLLPQPRAHDHLTLVLERTHRSTPDTSP